MAFYTDSELKQLGFKYIGNNVKVSTLASIYGKENIEIDDNSRIDDFCVISAGTGGVKIGKFVHIACFSLIIGKAKIEFEDFSGLSSRVSIYSSSDDYSGNFLTNPTVPAEYTNVMSSSVFIGKHVIIGTNSTVLPGVSIFEGAAIGAHSLVNKNIASHKIAFGIPAKETGDRNIEVYKLGDRLILKS
jgi:acetyltransferase-like isoleucine patch superfamily enzyme